MIEKDLAKELKDAGFPQRLGIADAVISEHGELINPSKVSLLPTLSELIDACDKDTLVLWSHKGKYFCGLRQIMRTKPDFITDIHTLVMYYEQYAIGDTRDEAVAQLWLALNKKL